MSGMTRQVKGFQNPDPRICLQAFPYLSSLPPPCSYTHAIFHFDSRSSRVPASQQGQERVTNP